MNILKYEYFRLEDGRKAIDVICEEDYVFYGVENNFYKCTLNNINYLDIYDDLDNIKREFIEKEKVRFHTRFGPVELFLIEEKNIEILNDIIRCESTMLYYDGIKEQILNYIGSVRYIPIVQQAEMNDSLIKIDKNKKIVYEELIGLLKIINN